MNWAPVEIFWQEWGTQQAFLDLVQEADWIGAKQKTDFKVPAEFLKLAAKVSCHRNEQRWALLYRILWRLTHNEKHLLEVIVDPDVLELRTMEKAVRHDIHKMRAFVRFRAVEHENKIWYVAWFEPEHHIVEWNAPFFADRFAAMNWSILTPERCVHWDGKTLSFTEGAPRSERPNGDPVETLWIRYYSSIFNPARVKTGAMQAEMPKRYWKNLPEAAVIPGLLQEAPRRSKTMMARSEAKLGAPEIFKNVLIPKRPDLESLRNAAATCQACPLYRNATRTVFGEGNPRARLVLVGEQPGDQEDKQGHPFVGPAGKLLDRALADAGIDRDQIYVTNAVKHFKWEPRGKVRLHKKAAPQEIATCRTWLEAEMQLLQPEVLLCLGETASTSVIGPGIRVMQDRGRWMTSSFTARTLVTVHPSSLLRMPNEETRAKNYLLFVDDLRMAAEALAKPKPAAE